MAIMKMCNYCGKVRIAAEEKYCSKCKEIVNSNTRDRYKKYNKQRYNDPEQYKYIKFYNSKLWKTVSKDTATRHLGLCLVCLYEDITGKKIEGTKYKDCIHHIVELKDDYDKRADKANLISLCNYHHKIIHDEYIKGLTNKKVMQQKLMAILIWFEKNFNILYKRINTETK